MKLNLINGRCIEFKTRVQSLEREITAAIQFIKGIENQYWDVLKSSHNNEDSHLLDALQKMGEKFAHYFNQEKDQIWIAESVAKISAILRQSTSDLNLLANNVLQEIVKRIEASAGAIFVAKEEHSTESVLEMRAGYAIAKKKSNLSEIQHGQGLVGQCFLKGEKIYMTQVPKGYMPVTSGLGEAAPRCILLLPLKLNDQTVGVIELASFTVMTSAQLLYLEKISESVAGAIQSVKETERTEKLLEQSKIMTLELTRREDELQKNVEELKTIREDQLRKQKNLEIAYAEIQEKNKEIEGIQKRETELIESKLKTHQEITDKVITKLKSKIGDLQKKIQVVHPIISSSFSN